MSKKLGWSFLIIGLLFALTLTTTAADEEAQGEEGLYTEEQIERGEEAYARHCAGCHGAELQGIGSFPPLVGAAFWERWEGRSAYELYRYVHDKMPMGRGGALSDEEYADIFAYMLLHYGYPAGEDELVPDEEVLDFALEPENDDNDDEEAEDEENDD